MALGKVKLRLGGREPFKLAPRWSGGWSSCPANWCCFSCLASPPPTVAGRLVPECLPLWGKG